MREPTQLGGPITEILERVRTGDRSAKEELLTRVYAELRAIAARSVRPDSSAFRPTTLVHEAYLRLFETDERNFHNCRHFFFSAARAMRDILVEEFRRRSAARRDHGEVQVEIDALDGSKGVELERVLAIDEALELYARSEPMGARVVDLRFFVGLEHAEIAATLGVSLSTVERRWVHARAWLARHLASTP